MPLQAVLFDCDGVIADSEAWWNQIDAAMLEQFGVPGYRGEHKRFVIGKSFFLSASFYRDKYGLTASVDEMLEARTRIAGEFYRTKVPLYPQAAQVLRQLRESGLKLALATSSVGALILPFLARHGLDSAFDAVVTGERVRNGKPHPDIYQLAAREAGVPPQACLVVEDALAGIEAGRAAGARTVAIPDARWGDASKLAEAADESVHELGQVVALCARLKTGG